MYTTAYNYTHLCKSTACHQGPSLNVITSAGIWIWNIGTSVKINNEFVHEMTSHCVFLTKTAATNIVRCEESDGDTPGAQI